MTADELHRRARALAAERRISVSDALAELGRRGARKRNYGRIQLARVTLPHYWWNDVD